MKNKFISLLLVAVMAFSLASCTKDKPTGPHIQETPPPVETSTEDETPSETPVETDKEPIVETKTESDAETKVEPETKSEKAGAEPKAKDEFYEDDIKKDDPKLMEPIDNSAWKIVAFMDFEHESGPQLIKIDEIKDVVSQEVYDSLQYSIQIQDSKLDFYVKDKLLYNLVIEPKTKDEKIFKNKWVNPEVEDMILLELLENDNQLKVTLDGQVLIFEHK